MAPDEKSKIEGTTRGNFTLSEDTLKAVVVCTYSHGARYQLEPVMRHLAEPILVPKTHTHSALEKKTTGKCVVTSTL